MIIPKDDLMKKYIPLIAVLVLFGSASSLAKAVPLVIDFEDVITPSYGYTSKVDTKSNDFIFSNPLPYGKGVISDPVSACSPACASNGTNYLYGQSGLYNMTSEQGLMFDLISFDVAELQPAHTSNLTSIEIVGNYLAGGSVSYIFNLDGIVDGPSGLEDFESIILSNSFLGLGSVTFTANNDYFALDNLVVEVITVSEPAMPLLFLSGLIFVGMMRRKAVLAAS